MLFIKELVIFFCDVHSNILSYAMQISNKKTAIAKQNCNLIRIEKLL